MQLVYSAMIVIGLAGIVWGLPAAHRLPRPMDIVAALVVFVGLAVALLGVLLVAVPGFFKG